MTEQQKEAIIDRLSERLISRKFLAWITATLLLAFTSNLDADNWVIVTSIYIGGQTVIDAVAKLRGA
jgi:hypothetical protein